MRLRILNTIGEIFDNDAKKILEKLGKVDYLNITQAELIENIKKYDIILCGLGLNFTSNVLDGVDKLKIIATATTGLDHIDLKKAEEKKIKIVSLKEEVDFLNTITGTAELALGLMILLARNIPASHLSVLKGEWNRENFKGHSLFGKTLGIVGLGRLGKMMATYGSALGMKVVYVDPYVDNLNWRKIDFDELLKISDYISIHTHLNNETENMFNIDSIRLMKRNACIINTSRGKIVDEKDIIHSLQNNIIDGYATDVIDGEIFFEKNNCSDHVLVKYAQSNSRVIITPHIGGMTYESRRDTDIFLAQKLFNMFK